MKYIYLDSSDNANETKDNSNVLLRLDESISRKKIKLKHFEIANSHYNVTSDNNKLELDSSAVSLTPGSYNLTNLMAHLDTQLTASNSHNFTISYDNDTGYVTISSATGNFTLDFNVADSCHNLFGYGKTTTYSGASTYTGAFIPELNDNIFVDIDRFGSEYITSDSKRPVFIIPNKEARHNLIFYNEKTDFDQICYTDNSMANSINVQLRNKYNKRLTNASNWKCILEILE